MKTFLIPLATFFLSVLAVDKTRNPSLVAKIKTDATQLDKLSELPSDLDWLFDFTAQSTYTYSPGSVVNANAATFPAAVGTGMTMAMLSLGPCAMLPPHFHPRATNFVVAVEGETQTWMIQENGARTVTETLTPGKMTIFPMGSLHTMQNMKCTNATLVSALNSEDTGTLNLANGLWGLPDDIIQAAFGGHESLKNIASIRDKIPSFGTGSSIGSAECIARCKNHHDDQPQRKKHCAELHDVELKQKKTLIGRIWW